MRRFATRSTRLLTLLVLALVAIPASADWLVTREGAKVETRGPWQVKGRTVVFTLANGTLSSMRLEEVDLEQSHTATAEAAQPPAEPAADAAPAKRASVMVLTNKDVRRAAPAAAGESRDAAAAGQGETGEEQEGGGEAAAVEVLAWDEKENAEIDGLEITGTVRNLSPSIVTDVGLKVTLVDTGGDVIATREAFLDSVSIAARSTTTFRALFPNVVGHEGPPRFEVRSRDFQVSLEPGGDEESLADDDLH